ATECRGAPAGAHHDSWLSDRVGGVHAARPALHHRLRHRGCRGVDVTGGAERSQHPRGPITRYDPQRCSRSGRNTVERDWGWIRLSSMRLVSVTVFVLVGILGCGAGPGGAGEACTQIGAPTGVSVDVAAAQADDTTGGGLRVCWDGSCVTRDLELDPSTASTNETCESGVCSAESTRTGAKNGFVT